MGLLALSKFSGLMEDYGVGYERLVAGENKDMGTPYQKLNPAQADWLNKP